MKLVWHHNKKLYAVSLVFWTLLSLFTVLKAGLTQTGQVYWAHIFSYTFTSGLLWAVFVVPLYALVVRWPIGRWPLWRLLLQHVLAAAVIVATQRWLSMSLDYALQRGLALVPDFPNYGNYFAGHFWRRFAEGMLWYGLIVAILYGYNAFRNNRTAVAKVQELAYITIKSNGKFVKVAVNDICYIKADGNYLRIMAQEEYRYRCSMKKMIAALPAQFYRIHHSYVVNVKHVHSAEHVYNGEYQFAVGNKHVRIPSSTTYNSNTRRLLEAFGATNGH